MNGRKGILQRNEEQKRRKRKGIHCFHKKQRSCALNVVYYPTAFKHNIGHNRKIRIKKHKLSRVRGCLRSACHSDGAIRVLKRKNIVYSVAGHADSMTGRLKRFDYNALLFRTYPAENNGIQSGG